MIDHAPALAKASLPEVSPMLVAGEMCSALEGDTLPAIDPTTGSAIGALPVARAADVDRAVQAARRAFDEGPWWKDWGPNKRGRALQKLAALCREHGKELARIQALDVGMPFGFARRFDAAALARNLEYYASWSDKVYGDTIPLGSPSQLDYTRREPLGVVVALIPWNTPLLMVGAKLGPALATGNVVILKPSEHASLGALRFAQLALEAGLPEGVIQVISGDGTTGDLLVRHPGIDKISFTGGRDTARAVQHAAADNLVPTVLELGGKSPNLVFEDADLDRVPMPSAMGIFGLSGQACAAGSRLLVHRSIHDAVIDEITRVAGSLSIGDPLEPWTMLGPLVHQAH
ncbi:MAG: aldehyde dehydrogenase family protein, partial [Myxococcota bacterium]|nr:aldehyde dehydrogenase family protein [Myxococcota bacterium]